MIDIHCHILPGIDDGPQLLEQSIDMARAAVEIGITTIIATPHHLNGRYNTPAELVFEAVDLLNNELNNRQIPLKIEAGQEIHVHPALIHEFYRGNLCSLANSRYMLLELPTKQVPPFFQDVLHELKINGITPIIAHPERNRELMNSRRMVLDLFEKGVLFQITANSITGLFGRKAQKFCLYLCKKNYLHFISSDSHDLYRRTFGLRTSYSTLAKQFGDEYVERLQRNALRVLEDKLIISAESANVSRNWLPWFSRKL
ncbi:protein-tyrosine phosphatase [Paenibacillus sp. DS2015]|uniref:tyrosine-protein phosphatase n=1 Tax=Paenibacillus sp. DS2015 TaxID=3373917 RepID=UPI003D23D5E6